jgi:hypothetical protein
MSSVLFWKESVSPASLRAEFAQGGFQMPQRVLVDIEARANHDMRVEPARIGMETVIIPCLSSSASSGLVHNPKVTSGAVSLAAQHW